MVSLEAACWACWARDGIGTSPAFFFFFLLLSLFDFSRMEGRGGELLTTQIEQPSGGGEGGLARTRSLSLSLSVSFGAGLESPHPLARPTRLGLPRSVVRHSPDAPAGAKGTVSQSSPALNCGDLGLIADRQAR